jgi:hypothetical protein
MAYKKLTRRSYNILKTTIWLLPVVNSSTCKSWNITKHDHRIYHIYHTHHILWQYHIINTPCKNKLDASNLLIAYFTRLMGATLKNGSYLRKATMLILELPKSCCKSDDNYSGRYRHPPTACMEQATVEPVSWTRSCKVGLGRFNPTIPRHQEVHEKKLAPKTSTPATILLRFTRVKHLCIYLALISLKGFASQKTKKFYEDEQE